MLAGSVGISVKNVVLVMKESVRVIFRKKFYDWQFERGKMRSFECLNRVRNAEGNK